ncbi:MAG: DNA cytosine methyltransferase [Thermoguttaceae bacterium]|nr:DNA cytosine methyltransferase [Thermoguttaceae bacterium]
MERTFRIIDCFCGAGGLSLGFERAGFEVVYAFDIDEASVNTYNHNKKHHHGTAFVRDIYDVDRSRIEKDLGHEIGSIDVVIGGPPCQGFSIQRRGENTDIRNNLVLEFARLIQDIRPRLFVMENVGGLLSVRGKPFLEQVFKELGDVGYLIQKRLLLATDYGVPQSRKRVFVVGELSSDSLHHFSFPAPTGQALKTVRMTIENLMDKDEEYLPNHKADRLSDTNLKRIRSIKEGEGQDSLPSELQLCCHSKNKNHRHLDTYGRMAWDRPSPTITARFDSFSRGRFGHPELDRTITLREGARLQTFPDDFEFIGTKVEIASQIGNAVPPSLAEYIAKSVKQTLGESKNDR